MSLRLIFMGSPDFAVPTLNALVEAGHEIVAVYAQPPRPAGRGKRLRPTAVHARAQELGLEVRTPVSLKGEEEQTAFAALNADAAIVAAYGLILPQPILDAPKYGCLNVHPSALPRWRGAAPIQRAIMAGDQETDVCIMQMEAGLDTGPVLLRTQTHIGANETAAELHDRLAISGGTLMVEALDHLSAGTANWEVQPEDGVTYANKIDKAEARIDWTLPAAQLDPHIRGLSPFPGAWCEMEGERLKILLGAPEEGSGSAGKVLDDNALIACGSGALRLLRVQRAGKPPMEASEFLRGHPLKTGAILT